MSLWLHHGMGRAVPLPHDCPACRVPIDRAAAAARLAARIEGDDRAEITPRDPDDHARSPPRARRGPSR